MSSFTKTQIAALATTAIVTPLTTVSFSGLTSPVSSLEGPGAVIGRFLPATYFLNISRDILTKALTFSDLYADIFIMPLHMLSGGIMPYESIPDMVQNIMLVAPTTHFVSLTQVILYRGAGFNVVWPVFLAALGLFRKSVTLTQV